MKLNPPASSSDLEAAREIARRLHQRRRRADLDRGEGRRTPATVFARPAASAPAAPTRAAAPPRAAPPLAVPPTPAARVPVPSAADEPEPPSWDETEADEPEQHEDHLAGALGDLTDDVEAPEAYAEPLPAHDSVPPPSALDALPSFDDEEAESLAAPAEPDLPGIDVEDNVVSPDEMVGAGGEDDASGAGIQPPLSDSDLGVPEAEASDPVAALGPTEELFDEPPPPPSWDDVVESCRELAGASGAMIIDPAGQVFAARGDWPEPGPDAIAGRLVAMMERTLKDAPTRSVSAPVGGQHLTAWRVPLAEGLVTAAFIADAPLRSDVRSAIDAEIHRGAGA
jgi:hypothetical protein